MEIYEELNEDLVAQLEKLYQSVWFTKGRNLSDIKTMLKGSYLTLAFTENNKLTGFCRAISDGVYKAFLYDVIVDLNFQKKGIGKFIIETAINHNKLINVGHIELYCPDKITPFYHKMGFKTRSSLLLRYD